MDGDFLVTVEEMTALSHRLPSLHHLRCRMKSLTLSLPHRYAVLPPQLRSLHLQLHDQFEAPLGDECLAAVTHLESLSLSLASSRAHTLLRGALFLPSLQATLRSVAIETDRWPKHSLSDAQLDALRALPHLTSLRCTKNAALSAGQLVYLLREPHTLMLHHLCDLHTLDDEAVAALKTLTSLRELRCGDAHKGSDGYDIRSFDFLVHMPDLCSLSLQLRDGSISLSRALLAAAVRDTALSKLQHFELHNVRGNWGWTNIDILDDLLPCMPLLLRSLHLARWKLPSFAFLATSSSSSTSTLPSTLTSLRLAQCSDLPAGLHELHALKALESLQLVDCKGVFDMPLSAEDVARLRPPCASLPRLRHFEHTSSSK
jgi:hypothetical protein